MDPRASPPYNTRGALASRAPRIHSLVLKHFEILDLSARSPIRIQNLDEVKGCGKNGKSNQNVAWFHLIPRDSRSSRIRCLIVRTASTNPAPTPRMNANTIIGFPSVSFPPCERY